MKNLFILLFFAITNISVFAQGLTLPYTTGFDTQAQKAGWQEFRTGFLSSYNWGYGGSDLSSPTCVSHDYNVGANETDTVIDWFVSPALNFTTFGKITINVKSGGFSQPFPDGFEVWFGTNIKNPANGNFTLIANLSAMEPANTWVDTTIGIPFSSDSGYIALKYKTIGAAWRVYAFDDITISEDPLAIHQLNNLENGINVFPNPSAGSITIHSEIEFKNANITLYNMQGQKLIDFKNVNTTSFQIPKMDLSSGIYFINIKENNMLIATKKLVVGD
jgi:hypothetical protein